MNELQFSPISEKLEDSVDTVSFIYHQKPLKEQQKTAQPVCISLDRIYSNRLSYSLQLLKQFILFSSDQQSISSDYRYLRHQIQGGVDKLETSYGFLVKVVMGKAFQDIVVFSRKQQAYYNESNLIKMTKKCQRIVKKAKHYNILYCFKKIFQFNQNSSYQFSRKKTHSISYKNSNNSFRGNGSQSESVSEFIPESIQSQKSSVHSKSFRNNLSQKHYSKQIIKKVNSSTFTPIVKKKHVDLNDTKKKETYPFYQNLDEQLQQIYIVRESKTSKKKPTKFIRIPIISNDVKIIEYDERQQHDNLSEINSFDRISEQNRRYKYQKEKGDKYREDHQCNGCKYCKMVEQMTQFRMQRTYNFYNY